MQQTAKYEDSSKRNTKLKILRYNSVTDTNDMLFFYIILPPLFSINISYRCTNSFIPTKNAFCCIFSQERTASLASWSLRKFASLRSALKGVQTHNNQTESGMYEVLLFLRFYTATKGHTNHLILITKDSCYQPCTVNMWNSATLIRYGYTDWFMLIK